MAITKKDIYKKIYEVKDVLIHRLNNLSTIELLNDNSTYEVLLLELKRLSKEYHKIDPKGTNLFCETTLKLLTHHLLNINNIENLGINESSLEYRVDLLNDYPLYKIKMLIKQGKYEYGLQFYLEKHNVMAVKLNDSNYPLYYQSDSILHQTIHTIVKTINLSLKGVLK